MKLMNLGQAALVPLGTTLLGSTALASSHREAPAISTDPAADNTDLYAWVCDEGDVRSLCIVANYNPLELPEGGPNYNKFSDDVLYQIHITHNDDDGVPTLTDYMTIDVRFKTRTTPRVAVDDRRAGPGGGKEFFAQLAGVFEQTADVTIRRAGERRGEAVFERVPVAPPNIGQRTATFAYGNPSYEDFAKGFVSNGDRGYKFFGSPRDDAFYVNLAQVFDLGAFVGLNTLNGQPFRSRIYDVDPTAVGMFANTDPEKAPTASRASTCTRSRWRSRSPSLLQVDRKTTSSRRWTPACRRTRRSLACGRRRIACRSSTKS
jgi:hypothetical protein